jgi:hypothetical protein
MAEKVNSLNCGVTYDDKQLSILLYADDIAIISETEDGLQRMLNAINDWTNKFRMSINMEKTKIVHFRPKRKRRSKFNFKLGNEPISYVNNYKYLGLHLDEHLDYKTAAQELSTSASKALGALTARFINAKGLHLKTYTKLYNCTVLPVMHYAAAIWGARKTQKHDQVHHRALRTYLGVGKYTPIPGLYGETGWHTLIHHRDKEQIKFWLKLFNMNRNRLTKDIFNWDYKRALLGHKNWNHNIKEILESIENSDVFYGLGTENPKVAMLTIEKQLEARETKLWQEEIDNMPKLRTYRKIKLNRDAEHYVEHNHNRRQRSLLAKLRIGNLPINIEKGRHKNLPLDERTCPRCTTEIEDEKHFLLNCQLYTQLRTDLVQTFADKTGENLDNYSTDEQLYLLLNIKSTIKLVASYVEEAFRERTKYEQNNRR